jgi:hypothetical protein
LDTIEKFLFALLAVSFLSSCKEGYDKKSRIKAEVMSHYEATNDSLKQKAAAFLLSCIDKKSGIKDEGYQAYIDTIFKYKNDQITFETTIHRMRFHSFAYAWDHEHVSADYLIKNIDIAFDVYNNSSWKKNYTFQDFCEYVLPYRVGHEPINDWRLEAKYLNPAILNSFDVKTALTRAIKHEYANKENFNLLFRENSLRLPDLPISALKAIPSGSCQELSALGVFISRLYGIPTTCDFAPQFGNRAGGHQWNALLLDSLRSVPFDVPLHDTIGYIEQWSIIAKAYRRTFSLNQYSHAAVIGKNSVLPSFFNDPFIVDVTSKYTSTRSVTIPIPSNLQKQQKVAYVSVFNNKLWYPISWGLVESNGHVTFQDLGTGVVYLPHLIAGEGNTSFIDYPFIIMKNGKVRRLIPNTKSATEVLLKRKYPLSPRIQMFLDRMIDGEFHGSNSKEFKDYKVLYRIKERPSEYFHTVKTNCIDRFRYVRYFSPKNSYGNIAELKFTSSDGHPLTGSIVGTEGSYQNDPSRRITSAFDGDPLTFFDSRNADNSWLGYDLGNPAKISTISFLPRSDYNIIVKGDTYELFFWDAGWKSLGRKIAEESSLSFDSVPKEALLWLRNLSGGNEERVFTYENNEQVWW